MAITLTKEMARAVAMDAGTASMRQHGRHMWNEEDSLVASDKLAALMRTIEPDNPTWFISEFDGEFTWVQNPVEVR